MERKYIFQQSQEWWIDKDLDWLIENAEYVFNDSYHNGFRPHIKTKRKHDGCDVFELGNDKWGILIKGYSLMDEFSQKHVVRVSKDIEGFLAEYYNECGCEDFVNPKFMFWKKIFNYKLKFI